MISLILPFLVQTSGVPASSLPPILPKPQYMVLVRSEPFVLRSDTVIVDPVGTYASRFLRDTIQQGAGFHIIRLRSNVHKPTIRFQHVSDGSIKPEGYELHVDAHHISLKYANEAGAFYGVQTIRQLLPAAIEGHGPGQARWTIPAVDVRDYPRFPWRGMHLDVSRHFFPAAFIKKYIDYIALMKMNVFHWHLVDDGGWRIQIQKYPKLTTVGAWRYGITNGWDQSKLRFDPESHLPKYGGFYTSQEVRDIVKYASDRSITIVPEIEMPGHTMPVLAAYPELSCTHQAPATQPGQPRSNVYCAGNERTFQFIDGVLDEVLSLFPSKWIHIGGDEVDKTYWKACPTCQARIKHEGLKNEDELQSYFIRRIDKYLASKGRRLIGWDEILEGGLAKGATVMSWRGISGGIAAAKAGHDVVMSPYSHAYFDASNLSQTSEHVYSFDPIPPSLTASEAKHVLGGQANVWTEWIPTTQRVEYMIFPRMTAMSEALWSSKKSHNVGDYLNRMPSIFERLDRMGVNYFIPAPRVEANAVCFTGVAKVAAVLEKGAPGILRYALDGKSPTRDSSIYSGPLKIDHATTVNFAYVTIRGLVGDTAKVICVPAQTSDRGSLVPGWHASYFEGAWTLVPDFSKLTPLNEVSTDKIGIEMRKREEHFAFDFSGIFKAEKDGVYQFTLRSDDGSWLKVGNVMVVDNDGTHPSDPKAGTVWLPKGLHKIEVGYFQQGGGLSLGLAVQIPGTSSPTAVDSYVYRPESN